MLPWLEHSTIDFPPVSTALDEPNGLLAAGGDLSTERLVNAYKHGIFPWFNPGEPISMVVAGSPLRAQARVSPYIPQLA